jgi:hypothetical protein
LDVLAALSAASTSKDPSQEPSEQGTARNEKNF